MRQQQQQQHSSHWLSCCLRGRVSHEIQVSGRQCCVQGHDWVTAFQDSGSRQFLGRRKRPWQALATMEVRHTFFFLGFHIGLAHLSGLVTRAHAGRGKQSAGAGAGVSMSESAQPRFPRPGNRTRRRQVASRHLPSLLSPSENQTLPRRRGTLTATCMPSSCFCLISSGAAAGALLVRAAQPACRCPPMSCAIYDQLLGWDIRQASCRDRAPARRAAGLFLVF